MPYQNLSTEFYNLTKPIVGPKELSFYESLVMDYNPPILEAMCGSGRVLIPLLNKGFQVDGLDNSSYMLDACRKNCQDLNINLYNQSIEAPLPKKYNLIFIAIGSFQLIQDNIIGVLKNLKNHLNPEGMLVLETFSPPDALVCDPVSSEYIIKSPEGFQIVYKSQTTFDFSKQQEINQAKYEKIENGNIIATEEETNIVRWYYPDQMQSLLKEAGFSDIQIYHQSFEINKKALIYKAI